MRCNWRNFLEISCQYKLKEAKIPWRITAGPSAMGREKKPVKARPATNARAKAKAEPRAAAKSRRVCKRPAADRLPCKCTMCGAIEGQSVDLIEGGPIRWGDFVWQTTRASNSGAIAAHAKGDLCYVCSRVRSALENDRVKCPGSNQLLKDTKRLYDLFMRKRAQFLEAHVTGSQSGVTAIQVPAGRGHQI